MREIEAGNLDELTLGAKALEEHDQVEFEEDDRVNGGTPARGIALGDEVAHESEVEDVFEVAREMVVRERSLKGEQDRTGKIAGFGRTEHRTPPLGRIEGTMLPLPTTGFQQAPPLSDNRHRAAMMHFLFPKRVHSHEAEDYSPPHR